MNITELFKERYFKYSWQGYKNGQKVLKATGYYTIRGFHTPDMWDMMIKDIREQMRAGKIIDTATIKREVLKVEKHECQKD